MFSEDALLPISALQHILYCPRQCALIHLEQVWADNRFTAEGNQMHKRAHDEQDHFQTGAKITHSLPIRSLAHGLSGQCDIVEFHKDGKVICVEYKRGKPKAHRADEVQVCAQVICLEEMLNITIDTSFLFYGKRKRRTEVILNDELRSFTIDTAISLHDLIDSRITPSAEYDKNRCDACSLIDLCQPKTLRLKLGAKVWFYKQLQMTELRDTN